MNTYYADDFIRPNTTTDEIFSRPEGNVTVFTVDTEIAYYIANTLDGALRLWRSHNDETKVLDIHKLG